jgi:ankyrin repeat protein
MEDVSIQDVLMGWVCDEDPAAAISGIDEALAQGVDFTAEGIEHLYYAAFGGKPAVVAHLLKRGATLTDEIDNNNHYGRKDKDRFIGSTALHAAAERGDIETLRLLFMSDGKKHVNLFDSLGRTPLIIACEKGDGTTARCLIQAGADVNAHDEQQIGDTAIRRAAERGHLGIVESLLRAGANPTIPGWMHLSAIHKAQMGGKSSAPILEAIRKHLKLPEREWKKLLLPERKP